MYSVKFIRRDIRKPSYLIERRRLWYWQIVFRENKVVATGSIGYASKKSASRAFWRLFSGNVIREIHDNYVKS